MRKKYIPGERVVMKKVIVVSMLVAACAMGCRTTSVCGTPDSSGWEDVFNADLSNAELKEGSWKWDADGFLVAQTGDTLLSKKDYENFVLDVAYLPGAGCNSGLFLYDTKHPTHKFEVQVLDDSDPKYVKDPPYFHTGAIYGRLAPTKICSKPANELNRMVVYCRGPRVTVFVNGEKVIETDLTLWKDPTTNPDGTAVPEWHRTFPALGTIPFHGAIGLQGLHGGKPVRYKYVRVKELD